MRKFVAGDIDAGLGAFLLGEDGIEKLIHPHLVLPMMAGHLRKIRKFSAVQCHAFPHQFPANAGNYLLAPGVEQTRKRHAGRRGGAAQLASAFHEQRRRAGAGRLDCRNDARGAAPDDQHVGL